MYNLTTNRSSKPEVLFGNVANSFLIIKKPQGWFIKVYEKSIFYLKSRKNLILIRTKVDNSAGRISQTKSLSVTLAWLSIGC
jgi:hypothetical protein